MLYCKSRTERKHFFSLKKNIILLSKVLNLPGNKICWKLVLAMDLINVGFFSVYKSVQLCKVL